MNKNSRKYRKLMEIRSKNSIRWAYGRMPENFTLTCSGRPMNMKEFISSWLLIKTKL